MSKALWKETCWKICIWTHIPWYSNNFSWWLRCSENESNNHQINSAEWQVSIPAHLQVRVIEPATSLLIACIWMHIYSANSSALQWKHVVGCSRHTSQKVDNRVANSLSSNDQLELSSALFDSLGHVLKVQVLECIGMHPLLLHSNKHAKYCRIVFSIVMNTNH